MTTMKLAQVIRENFDQITQWRSERVSWEEIDAYLRGGVAKSPASTRLQYAKEDARQNSAARLEVFHWVESRYIEIEDLRSRGYSWSAVLAHFSDGSVFVPRLTELIREQETGAYGFWVSCAAWPRSEIQCSTHSDCHLHTHMEETTWWRAVSGAELAHMYILSIYPKGVIHEVVFAINAFEGGRRQGQVYCGDSR